MVKDWLRYYDFIRYFFLILIIDGIGSEIAFPIFLFKDLIYIFLFLPSSFLSRIDEFLQELYYSFENTISKQLHGFETEATYAFFLKSVASNHSYSYFSSIALFFLLTYQTAGIFDVIPRYYVQ
jgi:hypothetical protein